jgi:hypothetical protein
MNAIQTVKNCVIALIQSVSDLSILREWNELNANNADLQAWVSFMTKVEAVTKNQQNNQKQILQHFLQERIPFFRPEFNPTIFEDLDVSQNPSKAVKLVAGHVQSGKTAVICGLALYLVQALRMPTVIVVRNYTADYLQLARKFSSGPFKDSDILVHYAKDANIRNMFSENYPALIVCLEHQTQLRKVLQAYRTRRVPFCLIADEADAISYKIKTDKERIIQFNILREVASQFIAVTATAFDMLYLESRLENRNIYHVPVPEAYKGIDHPDFTLEELKRGFDFKMENEVADIWTLSGDMEQFYREILNTPVFQLPRTLEDEKELIYETHPVICLQKTETEIKKQLQCMSALIRHPVFGKEFVVIAYNGEGVYAYSPQGLEMNILDADGESCRGEPSLSNYLVGCPVLHYKSLGIGDILQYFRDQESAPTHIVIIAGQMVGRGLNIVSNDYQWHLTHQILRVSDTATCADITQSCRVFGVYHDSVPTRLYCLQKDAMSLKQSHFLQRRIYEGANLHDISENMPTLCEQIKMFVGHIPRRRTTKKCTEPEWNKVAKEQEQYGEVDSDTDLEEGQGWLVYTTESQRVIYNAIEEVLSQQNWINVWVRRNEIEHHLPERTWDRRKVTALHNSQRIGSTRIQYRKQDNRVEYKLLTFV